ncbi:hypothetical protein K438DRAFT_1719319 [Mycena galopus ATCC 62051]|nr:hypothetical protein K438DRAFT_1719319 [Mycena galopus ATCC 62051]
MSVIVYRYNASPYSIKIDHVLLLKNIPSSQVTVANVLPRPEITELLGITHRRIPILAVGNDVYCDTSLIVSALERRFPASAGYGTIFPNKKHGGGADTGLIKAFVSQWVDSTLFSLGVGLVPWESLPPTFVKDRETQLGLPVSPSQNAFAHPRHRRSVLCYTLILTQLSDGREWLFETDLPSLADVCVHFIFSWIKRLPGAESLFDANTIPKSLEWIARLTAHLEHLKQTQPAVSEITGSEAAARISEAAFEPYAAVGFDAREAERLALKPGDEVSVTREDDIVHKFGTVGKLFALNREEFVLETQGSVGLVRCHFPRIGFAARPVSELKK